MRAFFRPRNRPRAFGASGAWKLPGRPALPSGKAHSGSNDPANITKKSHLPAGKHSFRNYSLSTCEFSSSMGVSLPKIFTVTFSFFFSGKTSLILPLNPAKAPEMTLTVSPTR